MKITILSLLCVSLAVPTYAKAEDVDELARLAKLTISAWSCFTYAPDGEEDRLYILGMESGVKYLERMAKISDEDRQRLSGKVAGIWSSARGPSIDFALGRLFEATTRNALRDFPIDDEDRDLLAMIKWDGENCALLK